MLKSPEITAQTGFYNLNPASNPCVHWAFASKVSGTIGEGHPVCLLELHLDDLEKNAVLKVDFTGAAEKTGVYFQIEDDRKNTLSSFSSRQLIWQTDPENRWRPITTQGLFRVKEAGGVNLSLKIYKGDLNGIYHLFHLSLVATVIEVMRH